MDGRKKKRKKGRERKERKKKRKEKERKEKKKKKGGILSSAAGVCKSLGKKPQDQGSEPPPALPLLDTWF